MELISTTRNFTYYPLGYYLSLYHDTSDNQFTYCHLKMNKDIVFKISTMMNCLNIDSRMYRQINNLFTFEPNEQLMINVSEPALHISYSNLFERIDDSIYRLKTNTGPIISTSDFVYLPVYLGFDGMIKTYMLSVVHPFEIEFSDNHHEGNVFSYFIFDFVSLHDDMYSDFRHSLNALLSPSIPVIIKTSILSYLSKYNIKHGKNTCRFDLNDLFNDDGKRIINFDAYKQSCENRTVCKIWSRKHEIQNILSHLSLINDQEFQASFKDFIKFQYEK